VLELIVAYGHHGRCYVIASLPHVLIYSLVWAAWIKSGEHERGSHKPGLAATGFMFLDIFMNEAHNYNTVRLVAWPQIHRARILCPHVSVCFTSERLITALFFEHGIRETGR
jgi:hypothetical protein